MNRDRKLWGVVVPAALVFLWVLSAGVAGAADKVTLAFDWLTYAKMAPFYVAEAKGIYKAENLKVKMVRGFGSMDTAKRVGAGQVEFGMSTLTDTIESRTRGNKIKTVSIFFHNTAACVMYVKGKGINKPKDLEGRTVGGPLATDSWVLFPLFAKAQGINLSKIKHINMRPSDVYGALAGNVVDSIHGWITTRSGVLRNLKQKGKTADDLGIFMYAQGGVSIYSQDIVVREDMIAKKPDLVRRMVRAINRAKVWTIENPKEALETFWKVKPELKATSAEANRDELEVTIAMFKDDLVGKYGQGFPVRDKVISTQDAFTSAKNLPKEPVDNIYTDEFFKGMSKADLFPKKWGQL
ncbi:MAG: ABC transporter substrate-binding protein [Nitrospinota bacterium]